MLSLRRCLNNRRAVARDDFLKSQSIQRQTGRVGRTVPVLLTRPIHCPFVLESGSKSLAAVPVSRMSRPPHPDRPPSGVLSLTTSTLLLPIAHHLPALASPVCCPGSRPA